MMDLKIYEFRSRCGGYGNLYSYGYILTEEKELYAQTQGFGHSFLNEDLELCQNKPFCGVGLEEVIEVITDLFNSQDLNRVAKINLKFVGVIRDRQKNTIETAVRMHNGSL